VDSDTAGIIAVVAAALAVAALVGCALLAIRLRRLRGDQQIVLGASGERDVVGHVNQMQDRLATFTRDVTESIRSLEGTDGELTRRLEGAIAHCGVVRYDAMGEMTGRQSSSVALLDSHRSGVVFSSILLRDQARLYAKPIVDGQSELELSPEEHQAVDAALAGRPG
jgi:hypothetical protein